MNINMLPDEVQQQLEDDVTKDVIATPAEEVPAEYVIKAEDIINSDSLKKGGFAVGDKVINGELVRVNSKDNDAPQQFEVITAEDIASSPYLQEQGVAAGDYIVDGEIQSRNYLNNWEQFKYKYDKETGLVGKAAQYLESFMPLGQIEFTLGGINYVSPEELYGSDYMSATPEQRREILDTKIQQDLVDRYKYLAVDEDSAAGTAGTVTGVFADPSTLIPVAQGVKGAIAAGSTMSGGYSILDDLVKNQEVDEAKAVTSAILGGGLAAGGAKLVQGGQRLAQRSAEKQANKTIDEAEKIANQHIAAGGSQKGAMDLIAQEGIGQQVAEASVIAGRKPVLKSSPTTAQAYLDSMITKDSATSRLYSESLDKYLGALSTQVKNISEPIFGRLRKFEFDTHVQTANAMKKVDGFAQELNKLNTQLQSRIGRHVMNGEFDTARKLMPASMRTEFNSVVNVLDDVRNEMLKSGIEVGKIENYFPRIVKDLDGLINALGKKNKSKITRAIEDYAKRNTIAASSVPTEVKADIADQVARGIYRTEDAGKTRVQYERKIDKISPELEQFYASPLESLTSHLRTSINDINVRKFFGRDLAKHEKGLTNLDDSIGKMIQKESDAGNIDEKAQDRLMELLQSRFVGGQKSTGNVLGAVRDLGYAGTIANPVSAVVQLGDIGLSGALHGFKNTITAMFGPKSVRIVDLGLENVIAQELANPSKTARALNKLFKVSQFQRIDKLGKETVINAALKKNTALSKSKGGVSKLRDKWGKVFGDEFDSLVDDLQNGRVTDNVKLLAFNELADVQPIALSEMPPAYLNSPNGRLLYMLKSFTLKQYDLVRRNIVQEWTKGNKATAVKNAALYAGYVTAANVATSTVKDMMLGREVRAEDIPDKSLWALLGVFGINQYMTDRYLRQGDIKGAAVNLLVPATPIIDEAFTLGGDVIKGDVNIAENTRPIPIVGPLIYSWFGGGRERYNERLD